MNALTSPSAVQGSFVGHVAGGPSVSSGQGQSSTSLAPAGADGPSSIQSQTYMVPNVSTGARTNDGTGTVTGTGPGSADRPIPVEADGSRPKRSRLNRPCDSCRRSKTSCKITNQGPPCGRCADSGRACTFDVAPPPRPPKRSISDIHGTSHSQSPGEHGQGSHHGLYQAQGYGHGHGHGSVIFGAGNGGSEYDTDTSMSQNGLPMLAGAAFSYGQEVEENQAGPSRVRKQTKGLHEAVRQPSEITSFDAQSRFEPHVLTTDLFAISSGSDDTGGHVRQLSSDPKRPIYVVMQPKTDATQLPVAGAVPLQHIRTFLHHQPGLTEKLILDQYKTHVHPAMPIVLPGPVDQQHPVLLSTILATACSHSRSTRPLAAAASGLLATTNPNGLAENNLAGVGSAVMELNMRPNPNNRACYLLLARTIALAQLLGMHIDSSRWRIPDWEQELRIRLWWQLCIHDAWTSFLNSRPCHIQATNADVPLPKLAAILEASCYYGTASSDSARAFIDSCRLALMVRRLQSEVSVLQVTAPRYSASRRSTVSSLIKEVDQLEHDWRVFKDMQNRATGVTSFLLHLYGFRCMLRRIAIEFEFGLGSAFTVTEEHLQPFRDCVRYIAGLSELELDNYYLIYAAHIMGSVTSSLIRLSMSQPDELNAEAMQLLSTLLRALHRYQADHGWDLAEPALRRAASMAARLDDMQEHPRLALALRGGSLDASPLDLTNIINIPPIDTMPGADAQFLWDWTNWDINDINMYQ